MSRFMEGDGENPAELLYWPNLRRACKGKRGQKVLRDFIAALLAMPQRRLIADEIESEQGEVCAVGAYARYKGESMDGLEGGGDTIYLGQKLGMGKMIPWHLAFMNDTDFPNKRFYPEMQTVEVAVWNRYSDKYGKVAYEHHRVPTGNLIERGCTPEERWNEIYRWASSRVRWNLPAVP